MRQRPPQSRTHSLPVPAGGRFGAAWTRRGQVVSQTTRPARRGPRAAARATARSRASPATIVSWLPLTEPTICSWMCSASARSSESSPLTTKPPGASPNSAAQRLDGVGEHDLGAEAAGEAALGERRREAALGDVVGARERAAAHGVADRLLGRADARDVAVGQRASAARRRRGARAPSRGSRARRRRRARSGRPRRESRAGRRGARRAARRPGRRPASGRSGPSAPSL